MPSRKIIVRHDAIKLSPEILTYLYFEKGHTAKEIADFFGFSKSFILAKMQKFGMKRRTKNIKPNLSPSVFLGYILGTMFGDGSTSMPKPTNNIKTYQVRLGVNDKCFAEAFARALKEIGLNPCTLHYGKRYHIVATSRNFVEWFRSLSLTDIDKIISGYESNFMAGFYDSEGYLCSRLYGNRKTPQCQMGVCNSDLGLIQWINQMLKNLGFYLFLRTGMGTYSQKPVYYLSFQGRIQTKKILNFIQPKSSKTCRYHCALRDSDFKCTTQSRQGIHLKNRAKNRRFEEGRNEGMIPLTPTKCRHCGKYLNSRAIKLGIDICRNCANFANKLSRKERRMSNLSDAIEHLEDAEEIVQNKKYSKHHLILMLRVEEVREDASENS